MTSVANSMARRTEMTAVVELAKKSMWLFLVMLVGGVAVFGSAAYIPIAVLIAGGLGSYAVLLLSWHYYRPRASALAWLVFSAATASSLVVAYVLPPVREGLLHPLGALLAMVAGFGFGVAAPITVFALRLLRWAEE